MPLSEQSITSGGTLSEVAIPADDSENLADGGQLESGRLDVNIKMTEGTISAS